MKPATLIQPKRRALTALCSAPFKNARCLFTVFCLAGLAGCTNPGAVTSGNPAASPIPPSSIASPIPVVPTPTPTQTPKSQALKAIESKLQAMVSEAGVPLQSVNCPATAELKTGTQVNCEALTEGKPFTIAITLSDETGQFQWSTKDLLLLSKLEQFIQKQVKDKSGVDVTADCGGKVKVAKAGDTFECQVKTQNQSRPMKVTVKDDRGSVDVKLL